MENDHLHICNPFLIHECLTIALEVCHCDLSSHDMAIVQRLCDAVKDGTEFDVLELSLTPEQETAVQHCLASFKETHTWRWLRGDFRDAVLKMDRHITRYLEPETAPVGCES